MIAFVLTVDEAEGELASDALWALGVVAAACAVAVASLPPACASNDRSASSTRATGRETTATQQSRSPSATPTANSPPTGAW